MVLTISWVTAITNLVEIGENDRMRWEIEPLLAILFGYALNLAQPRSTSLNRALLFLRRLEGA